MQRPGQCGHNLAIVRDCYGHIAIAAVRAVHTPRTQAQVNIAGADLVQELRPK